MGNVTRVSHKTPRGSYMKVYEMVSPLETGLCKTFTTNNMAGKPLNVKCYRILYENPKGTEILRVLEPNLNRKDLRGLIS